MDIKSLLKLTISNNASDLHIIPGTPPTLRINGELQPITNSEILTSQITEKLILEVLTDKQKQYYLEKRELDFSYSFDDGSRFRINVYFSKNGMAGAFRAIKAEIPRIDNLNLPNIIHQFADLRQGFILVTGPTGQGKSTTVASILEEINTKRKTHIVSIEDPIEYLLESKKSIISQREIGSDTLSFNSALRSCLREDPDVVFVGEMRDLESISLALTIAETGHLVFSTLHTNSAAQTIDRVIDVFPEGSKSQIRLQLASVLGAVISQRLLPTLDNSRAPAVELLLANAAVRNSIREGKTHMIDNIIQTSLDFGMVSLERSLAGMVRKGVVSTETAASFSLRPDELNRQLRGFSGSENKDSKK